MVGSGNWSTQIDFYQHFSHRHYYFSANLVSIFSLCLSVWRRRIERGRRDAARFRTATHLRCLPIAGSKVRQRPIGFEVQVTHVLLP